MYFIPVFVLLWTGLTVNSERHSLTYIYTALSKPAGLPGIHEFTAMGQLDGKMIDYFDSVTKRKVPKQTWMEQRLPEDYWEKGSQSRQSKQQWFKVNIEILMDRMRQNNSDVHVLQWMHGCEADKQPGGDMKLHRGMDRYSYDGENFLSFDDANEVWVAPVDAAKPTKKKWDEVEVLRQYTKGYLENECMDWLKKFLDYQQEKLLLASPPDVYVFEKKAKVETNVILMCLATGFQTTDTILQIKRDGRVVTRKDGLQSTGVRPNDGDTYQRRDHVEILKSDKSRYTCEVIHAASKIHIEKVWGETGGSPVTIIAVVGSILLLAIVIVLGLVLILIKKRIIVCHEQQGSTKSLTSKDSTDVSNAPPAVVINHPCVCVGVCVGPDSDVTTPLMTDQGSNKSLSSQDSGVSNAPPAVVINHPCVCVGPDSDVTTPLMTDQGSNKSLSSQDSGVSTSGGVSTPNPSPETQSLMESDEPEQS